MEVLDIVNEADEVIGSETREVIYQKGLLHRLIRVWFYTPKKEIILQLRGKNKKIFPGLLDATVGGHVETGESYTDTAIREILEETGISATEDELVLKNTFRRHTKNNVSSAIINSINRTFVYLFNGNVSNLKIEGQSEGDGFEVWRAEHLLRLTLEETKRFAPIIFIPEMQEIFKMIKEH